MSGEKNVPEKLHAELGASVASRWMACPGSIALSRQLPVLPSTSYAQEGTRAHSLAELCLSNNVEPDIYVGMALEDGPVDEDMADFVKIYIEHCRSRHLPGWSWWIERRFTLAALTPPGPMFGTADHVAYDPETRTLYVDDLKFGAGVVVEAKGNKQLRYYALGAVLTVNTSIQPIDRVVMSIIQPRASHPDGVIRSEEISYLELIEFAAELMDAARATQQPDAPRHAGSWCRFCPASGMCPEQRDHALAVVQDEFSVIDAEFVPPAPETIPPEQFAEMLGKLHILDDWMKAMRATALARLEHGEDVPGFKLVAKRATRSWRDEDGVEQYLKAEGYDTSEIFKLDLKSPAQIEKLVGKKVFAASPLAAIVDKVSSGYKMAPASDPAPAVTPAQIVGEEFARLLPAGEE